MPPVLYLVGTAQPYSTLQAAFDAVVLDYLGTLTADVEIRANAGETFTDNGLTDLIVATALATGGFRLTTAGANPNNPTIIDLLDNGSRFFFNEGQSGNVRKYTWRGFKIINNTGAHVIIGSGDQKNDGSIIERMDVEARSRLIRKMNSSSMGDPCIIRNNYVHGRDGGFYSDFPIETPYNTVVVGNTFRRCDKVFELDIPTGPTQSFDNIHEDIGINVIESNGSVVQFNANWTANGNLYYLTPTDFLSLYSVPAVYTLAQYRAFTSTPDATFVTADPLLVSFADPHIGATSPAKWAGVDNANLTDDIDGDVRHSPPSIGVDELQATGTNPIRASQMMMCMAGGNG